MCGMVSAWSVGVSRRVCGIVCGLWVCIVAAMYAVCVVYGCVCK